MKKIELLQWVLLVYKLSELMFHQSNVAWWVIFIPTFIYMSGFILVFFGLIYLYIWNRIISL